MQRNQRMATDSGNIAAPPKTSLYERLCAAGCEIDSHESDLYVRATPEAAEIVRAFHKETGVSFYSFKHLVDGKLWIEVPFHFDPFWEAKQKQVSA